MELLQSAEASKSVTSNAPPSHGLAGWIFTLLCGLRSQREVSHKQLRLVETLPLGGKRQLMLVSCGGENFLVGGGLDSVETIVQVKPQHSTDMFTDRDGSCR